MLDSYHPPDPQRKEGQFCSQFVPGKPLASVTLPGCSFAGWIPFADSALDPREAAENSIWGEKGIANELKLKLGTLVVAPYRGEV
jgi:hypothetical protein